MANLVLSLFPGIGLLDKAFEDEGFCVVRGPDVIWGGDVRKFNPPADRFDGVIGGPPCKRFSPLANINRKQYGEDSLAPDLIPEFARCVTEAAPRWWLMENVKRAPDPSIEGYSVHRLDLNNRWFGAEQNRLRRFWFGSQEARRLMVETVSLEATRFEPAVTGSNGGRRAKATLDENGRVRGKQGGADYHRLKRRSLDRICELQGLPEGFLKNAPMTAQGKREAIGNGVPLPMGRAIARAVKESIMVRSD